MTRISGDGDGSVTGIIGAPVQQPRRESSIVQWDSSSPGSSNPPSRRSSRSRSLVPAISTDSSATMEQQSMFQRQQQQLQQQQQKTTKKSQTQHLPRSKKKYPFPVKKYWLSRDPKDRSVGGNGVGMRIVGGKELADSGGKLAAYVARIFPGGLVEHIGGIHEGDVVVEWDGNSLGNKTFEEVSSILSGSSTKAELEVVIRSNYNVFTGKSLLPGSGDDDYGRRQSDCGTDMGSVITDSQSIGLAHQDTTDDNESDKSRPGEGTYSSSCTLASETTTPGKSSFPQSTASLTHAAQGLWDIL
ncbi:Protein piccolo [Orchesella cincta]|uniref:Protein piccolo n=1 Tax=Orchesella cincta TaxID=48709 RepID=A0A1D2NKI2_ORCCI|nr:Protein piccolo [Orchesella cincta]